MPTYKHEWQCQWCGKIVKRQCSYPDAPMPYVLKDCKGNPTYPQNKEHFMVKK